MSLKTLKLNGSWACVDCHADLGQPLQYGSSQKVRAPLRCDTCRPLHEIRKHWLSGRFTAAYAVNQAIRRGELPRARELACVDCGTQAKDYDHRDYGRPLDVEPVCGSCNWHRGSAKPLNQIIVSLLLLANADRLEA